MANNILANFSTTSAADSHSPKNANSTPLPRLGIHLRRPHLFTIPSVIHKACSQLPNWKKTGPADRNTTPSSRKLQKIAK